MNDPNVTSSPDASLEAIAARWIARRDRGLTEAEQAAYQKWLDEDPRHEAAMSRPEKNWSALDRLAAEYCAPGRTPNPDLLDPRRRPSVWLWAPLIAAAAALAFVYFGRPTADQRTANAIHLEKKTSRPALVRIEPERLALEDGSVVELNAQAKVDVQFTASERRVRLERGEAYFIVAKNAQRPFFVITPRVQVRAVGTEFKVGLGAEDLSVLVTEGKVRVDADLGAASERARAPSELSALVAGQQGVVDLKAGRSLTVPPEIKVTTLTPAEIDRDLAWRSLQLDLDDMPLGEVVAEFNRYNPRNLVIDDAQTAAVRVTGIFRANNVDAFVRLLAFSFDVSAFPQGNEIVLRKTHGR